MVKGDNEAESAIRALLSGSPSQLLTKAHLGGPALQSYAQRWLGLVAKELRAEISESLGRRSPRGNPEWILSAKPLRDSEACSLDVQFDGADNQEDDDDMPPPPLLHAILLSPDHDLLFFVSSVGDVCRALAFHAESFRSDVEPARLANISLNLPRHKCYEVHSAQAAVQRAHALCSVHLLKPNIVSLLTSGGEMKGEEEYRGPWLQMRQGDDDQQKQVARLNEGQRKALHGISGTATLVQGPPGTGKSSFITAAVLARVPTGARILACTATNKAIDSLVSKLEEAGMTEMLAVGSVRAMGERASNFLMSRRLEREPGVARVEAELREAAQRRFVAEQELSKIPKLKKKAPPRGEAAEGPLFIKRQAEKLQQLGPAELDKQATYSPGLVRMCQLLHQAKLLGDSPKPPKAITNAELLAAAKTFLSRPDGEADELVRRRNAAKAKIALLEKEETELRLKAAELRGNARARVWRSVRLVACTASAALQVKRRLERDMEAEEEEQIVVGKADLVKSSEANKMTFDVVILDEAAAMLEVDSVGCLIHGAKTLLMVGDQLQLPPFTKWRGAAQAGYATSLMARLANEGGSASFMLSEQYRMHPAICSVVSSSFYNGKLRTAPSTAAARTYPMPVVYVDVPNGWEDRQGSSTFNAVEAEAVVRAAKLLIEHVGFAPSQLAVLTFYNAQRDVLIQMLQAANLSDVEVASVDAMQGREREIVLLSCVRASADSGLGFLTDTRRVNVGLSRAKESLIVFGSEWCLRREQLWKNTLRDMRRFASASQFEEALLTEVRPGWAAVLGSASLDRDADDRRRHEAVWEQLQQQSSSSGFTMAADTMQLAKVTRAAELAAREQAEKNEKELTAAMESALSEWRDEEDELSEVEEEDTDKLSGTGESGPDGAAGNVMPPEGCASLPPPPAGNMDPASEVRDAAEDCVKEGAAANVGPAANVMEVAGEADVGAEPVAETEVITEPEVVSEMLTEAAVGVVYDEDATHFEEPGKQADGGAGEVGVDVVNGTGHSGVHEDEGEDATMVSEATSAAASSQSPSTPPLPTPEGPAQEDVTPPPADGWHAYAADVKAAMADAKKWDKALAARLLELASAHSNSQSEGERCLRGVMYGLLEPLCEVAEKKNRISLAKTRLQRGGKLVAAVLSELRRRGVPTRERHAALIESLVQVCDEHTQCGELFERLMLQLYELDVDVLPEDAILAWAENSATAPKGSAHLRFFQQSADFLIWLREAESDDEK